MTQTKQNEKVATGKAAGGNRKKQAAVQTAPAETAENPRAAESTEQAGSEIPATPETSETTEVPAPETVPAGKGEKKKEADRLPAFLAPYVKAYPTNKTFHVTTDRMIFLANDRGLAVMHQNSLKKGGAVETYNL